jgi:hypothetical protein
MRAVCLSGVLYEYMYGVLYRRLQLLGRREQETQKGTNAGSRREEAVTSVRYGGTEKARLTVVQREFSFLAPLEQLGAWSISVGRPSPSQPGKRGRGQTKVIRKRRW